MALLRAPLLLPLALLLPHAADGLAATARRGTLDVEARQRRANATVEAGNPFSQMLKIWDDKFGEGQSDDPLAVDDLSATSGSDESAAPAASTFPVAADDDRSDAAPAQEPLALPDLAAQRTSDHQDFKKLLAHYGIRDSSGDAHMAQLHEAAWRQNLSVDADLLQSQRTNRTCEAGRNASKSCKALCRWLKLSEDDFPSSDAFDGNHSGCPLVDSGLEALGYSKHQARGKKPAGVECVLDVVHSNVFKADLPIYVEQLKECLLSVSKAESVRYAAPLELLSKEVKTWAVERTEREGFERTAESLKGAVDAGEQALVSQANVSAAISLLEAGLQDAKALPGHHVVVELRLARELLEKLRPLDAAAAQLRRGMDLGDAALGSKDPVALLQAASWLEVSVSIGQKQRLKGLSEANETRRRLLELHDASEALAEAVFRGNVSLESKALVVEPAIVALNASIHHAVALNISGRLPEAVELLSQLLEVREAGRESDTAATAGRALLNSRLQGGGGAENLSLAVEALNRTSERAALLGLEGQATEGRRIVKALSNLKSTSKALHAAVSAGKAVLTNNTAALSQEREEQASALLAAVIPWAEESGISAGLPIARAIQAELFSVERAKTRMAAALGQAHASLTAKVGEAEAVEAIKNAVREERDLNVSGGFEESELMLRQLAATSTARQRLSEAVSEAKARLNVRAITVQDLESLNGTIALARSRGLKKELGPALEQLDRMNAWMEARRDLARVQASASGSDQAMYVSVNGTAGAALRVVELPDAPGSKDDGDDDFEEHIGRLERSIAKARSLGLVDPDMLVQLDGLKNLQGIYGLLQQARDQGEAAFKGKGGLNAAAVELEAAIDDAEEGGLAAGVPRARRLLQKLQTVPPLREELDTAMLEANVSLALRSGTHEALARLNAAMDHSKELPRQLLLGRLGHAETLRERLLVVNGASLRLKAASMQGAVALKLEHGEEAAIQQLTQAIEDAEWAGLHAETPGAVELLHNLLHVSAQQQQIQAAVVAKPRR